MEGKVKKAKKLLGNKYFRRANDELKVMVKSIGREVLSLISANEQKQIPVSENSGSNSNVYKKEHFKDIRLLRRDIKRAIDMTAGMAQTLTNVFDFLRGNQAPNDERVGIAVPQQINQDQNEDEEQNENISQDSNSDPQENFSRNEDQEQNETENDSEENNDGDNQGSSHVDNEHNEGDNEENEVDQRQDQDEKQSQKQENDDDSDSQTQNSGSGNPSTEQDEEQMIVPNGEDNVLMSTEDGQEFLNEDNSNASGSSYEESPTSEDSERRSGMERSPSPADVHFAATRGPIMFDKPGSRGQKCLTVSPMVDGHVISRAFVVIEKLQIPEGYTTVPVSEYEKDIRITHPVPRLGLPQTVRTTIETGSTASHTKCAKKVSEQVREKRKHRRRKCIPIKTSPSRTYSCPVAIAAPFNINVSSPQKVVRCTRSSSRSLQQQQQQQQMEVEAENEEEEGEEEEEEEEEAMEIGNDSDESSRATPSDQPGPSWAHDF